MKRDDWVNEFKVLNGRVPNPDEYSTAAKQDFSQPVPVDSQTNKGFSLELFIKIGIIVLLAVFGYIVGFLFA